MSKRKSPILPARAPAVVGVSRPESAKSKAPRPAGRAEGPGRSHAAVRETVESVVIAFVLAFLFRTFEAEAFVIPTGSMATTLMGRHKDLECPVCGYAFQVSASDEMNEDGSPKQPPNQIVACTCPMCRRPIDVSNSREYPSFNGDRILVAKFAYQFGDPQRWDVAVFHYPGKAQTNYIKRVVGLPGETVRIRQGDVFVRGPGEEDFTIARKPAEKLLAMLQPVYDNDLTPRIAAKGFPPRWSPWPSPDGSAAGAWQPADEGRVFETAGADRETWIRYQHRLPTARQWRDVLERGAAPPPDEVKPALISDFSGYNSDVSAAHRDLPLQWVGDLAVQCTLEVKSAAGQAVLELVKGGVRFQCRFDVASGDATLSIGGNGAFQIDGRRYDFAPTAKTKVRGPGKYDVLFANCDQQLRLWVDGREAKFDGPTGYPPLDNLRPTEDDMAPVGVGSWGAELAVARLKVLRDVYYTTYLPGNRAPHGMAWMSPDERIEAPGFAEKDLRDWRTCARAIRPDLHVDLRLDADQFFMLGDNSPKSKDSRAWGEEFYVKRELLIGKALFIYWPHSWDSPIPFWPNFRRMGFVR